MKFFRPKAGPILTRGRIQHAIAGGVFVLAFGFLPKWFGWTTEFVDGGQFGFVAAFLFGIAWEFSTPFIAERFRWAHPFGDFVDLISYHFGAIIIGAPFCWWA